MRDETVNMIEESIFGDMWVSECQSGKSRGIDRGSRAQHQSLNASTSKAAVFLPTSDHQFMAMSSIAHEIGNKCPIIGQLILCGLLSSLEVRARGF